MILAPSKSVIDINDKLAPAKFSDAFRKYVYTYMNNSFNSLILICIGTDRSTGDSLGPLIGYKLSKLNFENIMVYGTLDDPIHAKNLDDKLDYIYSNHKKPFLVAIDACLGHLQNIGKINISNGPIYPGAGVNKRLTPVGDINITGIVNVSGYMEYMVLQNTRLNLVMKMADTISYGISLCAHDINKELASRCG